MSWMRYAKPARCPECHAPVLQGQDGEHAAFTILADPQPIGTFGEALAHLAGRPTYKLRRAGRRHTLTRRDCWQIKGPRDGTVRRSPVFDVLAEHRCWQPLPAIPSKFTATPETGADDGPPPY